MITDRSLLARAVELRLITAAELERWTHPDPYAGLTAAQVLELVTRTCGAGAMAELPAPRTIPPPPGHTPRRGPRGRSPRSNGTRPADHAQRPADERNPPEGPETAGEPVNDN